MRLTLAISALTEEMKTSARLPRLGRSFGQHTPEHRLADEEGRAAVDREDLVPGVRRDLERVAADEGHDAGVVDQHLDAAAFVPCPLHHGGDLVDLGEVALAKGEAAALPLDQASGLLGALGAVVGAEDVVAAAGEMEADGAAHAAARAGDERDGTSWHSGAFPPAWPRMGRMGGTVGSWREGRQGAWMAPDNPAAAFCAPRWRFQFRNTPRPRQDAPGREEGVSAMRLIL
jgi:hypothetical protein